MKVRESGMPEEELWRTFFDPDRIFTLLDFTPTKADVVEFGCGYGTFTVSAALRTSGTVYALDIEPRMIRTTAAKVQSAALLNVRTVMRDFLAVGTGLADGSVGYAMLFNILHARRPVALLKEALRVLAPGGKVGVMHWIYDASTSRGPALWIRPRPDQCRAWLRQAGFQLVVPMVSLPPYLYGTVGRKPASPRPRLSRLSPKDLA